MSSETRFARLARAFPERAEKLFKESEDAAKERFERLIKLSELYNN